MSTILKDLIKHSGIYAAAQIFTRVLSLLLLPVYTRHLSPADYGVIAILDLSANVATILVGAGMTIAVQRFHFEARNSREQSSVWWTGLLYLLLVASALLIPLWIIRDGLAVKLLGQEVILGRQFLSLVLPTMWFGLLVQLFLSYLRVRKWSKAVLVFTIGSLLLNAALNLYFLIIRGMGVGGVLLGNLLTQGLLFACLLSILVANEKPLHFDPRQLKPLLRFGLPFVLTGLLSAVMHEADRFYIRYFLSMEEVGVYSIAYMVGQGASTVYLLPFNMIWNVVIFDIRKQENAKDTYSEVFRYFFYGSVILMLGVSLFAKYLLWILVDPDFYAAVDLVPIICLAFVFFAMHTHFHVPAILEKRSGLRIPAAVLAAAINAGLNIWLIPKLGLAGAAWASVGTYLVFSFSGLAIYRKIDRFPYPIGHCALVLFGVIGSFLVWKYFSQSDGWSWSQFLTAAMIWIGWFWILLSKAIRRLVFDRWRFGG